MYSSDVKQKNSCQNLTFKQLFLAYKKVMVSENLIDFRHH